MALTLIGTPPLNGFWGKYLIVSESFAQEHYLWGAAAVLVSMLTLYSMLKMWMEAFWKPHPDRHWRPKASPAMAPSFAGVTVLVFFTVGMGLFPNTMIDYAQSTAAALRETIGRGLDGVRCRSAADTDSREPRELAWFPRGRRARKRGVRTFGDWYFGPG